MKVPLGEFNPNPTVCLDRYMYKKAGYNVSIPGCDGFEPCEVVFVKYGGNNKL